MRTILVLSAALVVGSVPVTAGAQHGATGAPAAHAAAAPTPAAKSEVVATHAAKPAETTKPAAAAGKASAHEGKTASAKKPAEKTADAAKKAPPKSDLEAAFDRIAQKIQGAEVTPRGLRISASGGEGRAAETPRADAHTAEPRTARREATPRIHLTWRASVVWPAMPGPTEADERTPAPETSRITLAWQ